MPLPPTREDLGYKWKEIPIPKALDMLGKFLSRNSAKAYIMDVYATNNQVYRNIHIDYQGVGREEGINAQFNRDEGKQLTLAIY